MSNLGKKNRRATRSAGGWACRHVRCYDRRGRHSRLGMCSHARRYRAARAPPRGRQPHRRSRTHGTHSTHVHTPVFVCVETVFVHMSCQVPWCSVLSVEGTQLPNKRCPSCSFSRPDLATALSTQALPCAWAWAWAWACACTCACRAVSCGVVPCNAVLAMPALLAVSNRAVCARACRACRAAQCRAVLSRAAPRRTMQCVAMGRHN